MCQFDADEYLFSEFIINNKSSPIHTPYKAQLLFSTITKTHTFAPHLPCASSTQTHTSSLIINNKSSPIHTPYKAIVNSSPVSPEKLPYSLSFLNRKGVSIRTDSRISTTKIRLLTLRTRWQWKTTKHWNNRLIGHLNLDIVSQKSVSFLCKQGHFTKKYFTSQR